MNEWILQAIADGGYWGIVLLMALENIFPPIPSEVIMGMGGIAVAQGRMEVLPLMLAGTVGSTLGNYPWFLLGRALGYKRLRPFVARHGRWLTLDWPAMRRLVAFFRRHGQWVVFVMRFSPAMRTMISLPAGLAKMGHARFWCSPSPGRRSGTRCWSGPGGIWGSTTSCWGAIPGLRRWR
jgi:membrane protein DedA with SNARE-associated domain